MTTLNVAHIQEQGVNLIIVPLDRSFDSQTLAERMSVRDEIQVRAQSAGLAGFVSLIWETVSGRVAFIAHKNHHAFFQSISLQYVWVRINRQLSW